MPGDNWLRREELDNESKRGAVLTAAEDVEDAHLLRGLRLERGPEIAGLPRIIELKLPLFQGPSLRPRKTNWRT